MVLKCPNCNADIKAEHAQMFVNCRYCGVKIQTRDIIEVRHVTMPDSFEKMLSDGEIYYKLEDYYRAERKFREVIKHYPAERKGYEELIRTLTRNQTMYPLTHEEEVCRLLERLETLISEGEKEDFAERRRRMLESFTAERERVDFALREKETDMEKQREKRWRFIKI